MLGELLVFYKVLDGFTSDVVSTPSNTQYEDAILRERAKQPTKGSTASLGGTKPLKLLHPRAPVSVNDVPTSYYRRIDRY